MEEEESTVNPLISQLFGKKKYQYKLQLQGELPNTIFKERNINISVNLTDSKGEKILNCNYYLIQPTSSIYVWEFVIQTVNGLPKIGQDKTS